MKTLRRAIVMIALVGALFTGSPAQAWTLPPADATVPAKKKVCPYLKVGHLYFEFCLPSL